MQFHSQKSTTRMLRTAIPAMKLEPGIMTYVAWEGIWEEYTTALMCVHVLVPESEAKDPLGLPLDPMLGTRSSLEIADDRKSKIWVAGIGSWASSSRPRMHWKLKEVSWWTSKRAQIDLHFAKCRPSLVPAYPANPYSVIDSVLLHEVRHKSWQWCLEPLLPPLLWRSCYIFLYFPFFLINPTCTHQHINKLA